MAYLEVDPTTGELVWRAGPSQPSSPNSGIPQGNIQPRDENGNIPPSGATNPSGGISDYSDLARRLAGMFGGAAGANRQQNNILDQLGLQRYNSAENNRLRRDEFALTAPGTRLRDSTRASLTSNFTPTHVQWGGPGSGLRGEMPQITGGVSAGMANLDPRTKALSDLVMQDELAGQQKGGITGGQGDITMMPPPKIGAESGADRALGAAATGSSLADALLGGRNGPGGSVDISRIISAIRNRNPNNWDLRPGEGFGGPNTSTYGSHRGPNDQNDPFPSDWNYNDPNWDNPGWMGPSDPSGGTGRGPGMSGYYDWLNGRDPGGGGNPPSGTDWWDE